MICLLQTLANRGFDDGAQPMRYRCRCVFLLGLLCVVPLLRTGVCEAQVRKSCGDGITLRLNAALATQGSLLAGEVASTKALPVIKAEWDGRPIPVWSESPHKSPSRRTQR